eukprot:3726587-Rhodomonas_salina.1
MAAPHSWLTILAKNASGNLLIVLCATSKTVPPTLKRTVLTDAVVDMSIEGANFQRRQLQFPPCPERLFPQCPAHLNSESRGRCICVTFWTKLHGYVRSPL